MTAVAPIERLGNLGYGMMGVQVSQKVSVTPSIGFLFYSSDINTDIKPDEDDPIAGVRSMVFNAYMGIREHMGTIEVLAEPNTAQYWFDMLLNKGSITGGGDPYTHPFTEGLSNAYTLDILKGQIVERYFGVQAESMEFAPDKNKLKFVMPVSAIGSFISRKIKSVSTTTVVLDTDYDPSPTTGLVVGDLVRLMTAAKDVTLDTTVSSINADGVTLIVGASAAAFAAGDTLWLRPQTQAYSVLAPFLWARTEFRFGTGATAALSASQTRIESGSKWKISHKFNKKQGEDRSGGFDPDSLVRLQPEVDLTLKRLYDQPQDSLQKYLGVDLTQALVIRHFSGSNHELRITIHTLHYKLNKRALKSANINYEELTGRAVYNSSDGAAVDVKVINALSS